MKKEKIISMLYCIASVLYFLAAIFSFAGGNHNSMAFVWICFGFTFLCLGSGYKKKAKESEDDSNKE